MSYSPINSTLFAAAYAGALAGMVASGRYLSGGEADDYATLSPIAGAFAQAFDTAWDSAASPSQLEVQAAQSLIEGVFEERQPIADAATLLPATWLSLAQAVVAAIEAGDNYFSSIGVSSPAWPSGGGSGMVVSYVWRPGSPPVTPNTFDNFTSLYAAVSALPAGTSVFVSVDGTSGALTIPSGGPYDLNGWTFVDWTGDFSPIQFETGSVAVANGSIQLLYTEFQNVGTTVPFTVTSADYLSLISNESEFLANAGATPLIEVQAGGLLSLSGYVTLIGGGGGGVVLQCDNGSTSGDVAITLWGMSVVDAGAIDVLTGGGVGFQVTSDVNLPFTPSTIPTGWDVNYKSIAEQTAYAPALAASWSVAPTQTAEALDILAASLPSFVYRPGGTAGGNVFTTEASLSAAMDLVQGWKLLLIDTTFGVANFTAAHNLSNTVIMGLNYDTLNFDVGSSITSDTSTVVLVAIEITSTASGPVWQPIAGSLLSWGSVLLGGPSSPIVMPASGGGFFATLVGYNDLGDGTNVVFDAASGAAESTVLINDFCIVNGNALGSGLQEFDYSADVSIRGTQAVAALATHRITLASQLLPSSGDTAARPTDAETGQMYFDTSLASLAGKPVWWNGTQWVDATGTPA